MDTDVALYGYGVCLRHFFLCATFFMGDMVVAVVVHKGGLGGSAPQLQTLQILIYKIYIPGILYSNNSFNTKNFIHQPLPVGC
jgi:hypothetical protein